MNHRRLQFIVFVLVSTLCFSPLHAQDPVRSSLDVKSGAETGSFTLHFLKLLTGQEQVDERNLFFLEKLRDNGYGEVAERIEKREGPVAMTPMLKAKRKINILQSMIRQGAELARLKELADDAEAAQKEYVKTITNIKSDVYLKAEQELIDVMLKKGQILSRLARQIGGDNVKLADSTFHEIIKKYEQLHKGIGPRPDTGSPEEGPWENKDRSLQRDLIYSIWMMGNDFYQYFDKETNGAIKTYFQNIVLKKYDELTNWYEFYLVLYEVALYVGDIQMLVAAVDEPENREKNFSGALKRYGMTKALTEKKELQGRPEVRELVAMAYKRTAQAYNKFGDIKNQPTMYRMAIDTTEELLKKFPSQYHREEIFLEAQMEMLIAYTKMNNFKQAEELRKKIEQSGGKAWAARIKKVLEDLPTTTLPIPNMIQNATTLMNENTYKALAAFRQIINTVLNSTNPDNKKYLANCYFKLGECYMDTARDYEAVAAFSLVEEYKEADKDIRGRAAAKKMKLMDKIYTITKNKDDDKKANEFLTFFRDNYPEEFLKSGLEMRLIEQLEYDDKWTEAMLEAKKLVEQLRVKQRTKEPLYQRALWSYGHDSYKHASDLFGDYNREKDKDAKEKKLKEVTDTMKEANLALYEYRKYILSTKLEVLTPDAREQQDIRKQAAFAAYYRAWLSSREVYGAYKDAVTLLIDFEKNYEMDGFLKDNATLPASVHYMRIFSYTSLGDIENAEKELQVLEAYWKKLDKAGDFNAAPVKDKHMDAMKLLAFRLYQRSTDLKKPADDLEKRADELEKQAAELIKKNDPKAVQLLTQAQKLNQDAQKLRDQARPHFVKAAEYYNVLMDAGLKLNTDTVLAVANTLYEEAERLSNEKLNDELEKKRRHYYEHAKRRFTYYLDAMKKEPAKSEEEAKKREQREEHINRSIARAHTQLGEFKQAGDIYIQLLAPDQTRAKVYLWLESNDFYEGVAAEYKQKGKMQDYIENIKKAVDNYKWLAGKFRKATWESVAEPKQLRQIKQYYFQSLYKWYELRRFTDPPEDVYDAFMKHKELHSDIKDKTSWEEQPGWEEAALFKYKGASLQTPFQELEKDIKQRYRSLQKKEEKK